MINLNDKLLVYVYLSLCYYLIIVSFPKTLKEDGREMILVLSLP